MPATVDQPFERRAPVPRAARPNERAALLDAVLFACIGPTTAAALLELGAKRVVEAREQSDEGLVEALERAFEEERDAIP